MKKFLAIILATVMMASLVAAMSVSAGGVNLPKYTVDYEHFDKINGDKSPFSFVWYYQGTDPGETLGRGCYTMKYFEDTSMYHGTDANGEKLTAEGFPFFSSDAKCHPYYHGCPGMAFTAPFTGTVKFSYNFANIGGRTVLYIYDNAMPGEHTPVDGHWTYTEYAAKKDSKAEFAADPEKVYTFEVNVEMGETIYFLIDDYDDVANDSTTFRIVDAMYTSIDEDSLTYFVNYPLFAEINDDASNPFKFTWFYQNTEPNYPAINVGTAIYDMKCDLRYNLYFAYYPEYGNGMWNTMVRFGSDGYCHPVFHAGPGMTFTAPYTGTVEFSFNYACPAGKTALYIANNKVPGFVLNETQTAWLYNNYDEKIDSTTDTSKVYTFTAEVQKGDKVYFIVDDCDDMSNDSTLFKMLKAEYTSVSGYVPDLPSDDPDDNPNTSDVVVKVVLAVGLCGAVTVAASGIRKKRTH